MLHFIISLDIRDVEQTTATLALDPCLIYDTFRQTEEWRQAAEPAYSHVCKAKSAPIMWTTQDRAQDAQKTPMFN